GLEDQVVGLPVLPLVRRGDHARRAGRGRLDGVQFPGRARSDRVPVHARSAASYLHLVGFGSTRFDPRPMALARGRPADRSTHRMHVRAGAGGGGRGSEAARLSGVSVPRRPIGARPLWLVGALLQLLLPGAAAWADAPLAAAGAHAKAHVESPTTRTCARI